MYQVASTAVLNHHFTQDGPVGRATDVNRDIVRSRFSMRDASAPSAGIPEKQRGEKANETLSYLNSVARAEHSSSRDPDGSRDTRRYRKRSAVK